MSKNRPIELFLSLVRLLLSRTMMLRQLDHRDWRLFHRNFTGCLSDAVVDFKLATLMFKSLHGCASSYLSNASKSAPEASRHLRSSAPSHAPYRGPELVWATGRLMSPDHGFGTNCLLNCRRLTVSANSEDSWKRFCLSRTRLRRLVTLAFRRRI